MKMHTRRLFVRELLFSLFTLIVTLSYGIDPAKGLTNPSVGKIQRDADYGSMPFFFIPKQGQFDERVKHTAQGRDKAICFTSQGLTFVLTEQIGASPSPEPRTLREIYPQKTGPQTSQKRWVVKLDFVGANHNAPPDFLEQAEKTMVPYFKGRTKEWKTSLQTSSMISYRNLWPGIDLIFYGTVNRLKYDFIVLSGADPTQVRLAFRGADKVQVTPAGRLEVTTPLGVFQDGIPVVWQENNGKKIATGRKNAPIGQYRTARLFMVKPVQVGKRTRFN